MFTNLCKNYKLNCMKVSTQSLSQRAFSLVELSIVLVILGLLVGGVLSGQSLIRSAELRSISTDYSRYVAAVHSFRDKYFALPGDMNNAQSFWGIQNATPATCVNSASTTIATCNGNGDGIIQQSAGSNESYRFWQQLANAGLIEGSYSGVQSATNAFSSSTANSPKGKISSTLWFVWNWAIPLSGEPAWFDGTYGNRMSTGGSQADGEPGASILTPAEIWNIDTKMDDGKPAQGKVWSQWLGCTDAANSAALSASYVLTSASKLCFPVFPNAF